MRRPGPPIPDQGRRALRRIAAVLLFPFFIFSCGGDSSTPGVVNDDYRGPQIFAVSPPTLSVGESLTVSGSGFLGPHEGETQVHLVGTFFDDEQQSFAVDHTAKANYRSQAEISWRLWPDVSFHPQGNRLGYFVGEVEVITRDKNGASYVSSRAPQRIDIRPSLVLRTLKPLGAGRDGDGGPCLEPIVPATVEDTPFSIAVEAVGFGQLGLAPVEAGNRRHAPINFIWNFFRDAWDVKADGNRVFDADSETSRQGTISITDSVVEGVISGVQDGSACGTGVNVSQGQTGLEAFFNGLCRENRSGSKQFLFKATEDLIGTGGIKELKLRKMPQCPDDKVASECPDVPLDGHVVANFSVSAQDTSGHHATLTVPLDVYQEVTMKHVAAEDRIVERLVPEVVHQAATSSLTAQTTYRESTNTTLSRDKGFNFSPQAGGQVGFIRSMNFSVGFGVDMRESFSKSREVGNDISQEIIPGFCATFWRQSERIDRIAHLTGHQRCGAKVPYGSVTLIDWRFNRDVVQASQCPARPEKLKPPGACTVDCQDFVSP